MKVNRRQFLMSAAMAPAAGLLSASAQPFQPPRHLLGERDDVPDVVTPLGIKLNTGAFEVPRWKRLRKSERWLREQGVPEQWIHAEDDSVYDQNAPDLYRWCRDLWMFPSLLATWTDTAYIASRYRHLHYALRVIIQPAPFLAPDGNLRMSWLYSTPTGIEAHVAIVHVSLQHDPNHARVRTFRNEVAWILQT